MTTRQQWFTHNPLRSGARRDKDKREVPSTNSELTSRNSGMLHVSMHKMKPIIMFTSQASRLARLRSVHL